MSTLRETAALPALRERLFGGGPILVGLQMLTILIKLSGLVLITRLIGPGRFGPFAAGFGIFTFLLGVGQSGVGVYLTRHGDLLDRTRMGTATAVLLGLAAILVATTEGLAPVLAGWTHVPGTRQVLRILMLSLPLQTLSIPALTTLRRRVDLKAVAFIDLLGQLAYYALPLIWLSRGIDAQVLAWSVVLQYAVMLILAMSLAREGLHLAWDRRIARDILRYTSAFSAANYVWQMRSLAIPFIVAPVLGGEVAGTIGMALTLLEILTLARTPLWMISVAVLGRLSSEPDRIRRAVTEGMELQLLVLGGLIVAFGWFGQGIVGWALGRNWLPMFVVYPGIAVFYLTLVMFNMHTAVLAVLNRTGQLGLFQAVNVVIFLGAMAFAVRFAGPLAYGYAAIAALPSYLLLHVLVARRIGSPDYRVAAPWWAGAVVALFWRELGVIAIAGPIAALLLPLSVRRLQGVWSRLPRPAGRQQE